MKNIVVSAVNLRKGGTLTILRECLHYLSGSKWVKEYRIIALVHKKELAFYPNIEYVEMPDTIKSWGRRLWREYVTMYFLSKKWAPVYLWLSLHDTTPNVQAERQVVYCQTSFPFLQWRWKDCIFDYKIVLFSLFTRFAYQINIKRNRYLIVQADWLRKGLANMFHLPQNRFIVAPPELKIQRKASSFGIKNCFAFFFPATPDCHKNFEQLCEATRLLEEELGKGKFQVWITINGKENRYTRWLYRKWGKVNSLKFSGFMDKKKLYATYTATDCLVFPSRVETWGLPISEFAVFGKPMLLADLPYAHETAAGCPNVAFFNPSDPQILKEQMKRLIQKDTSFLTTVPKTAILEPVAYTWDELFERLLS